MRVGELCTLTAEGIVIRDHRTFLKVTGKGDNDRLVPLPPSLARRLEQWGEGHVALEVYGNPAGNQRHTSAGSRTDWQIVKDFFGRYPERFHATFRIPSANPPVKDRVNCVNAKMRNHAGQYRLLVNPGCKALIKDFEQVCWKTDPHGNPLVELDHSDPMRTHVSDALGYLIAREFPMRAQRGERSGPAISLSI